MIVAAVAIIVGLATAVFVPGHRPARIVDSNRDFLSPVSVEDGAPSGESVPEDSP